ncbi:DUF4279 domain-containing protein [Bacillus sp. OAE603]|uniref:DUF4279 domain-containing protein n=1 Tax=Gottfriedia sp. OAE603 TaxID=2663872 RepID=UPI00178B90F4
MDQTNVMTYFEIKGDDFPLEYVTELLGIYPTNSFIKGEEIKRTKNSKIITTKRRFRTYTSWKLGTDYIETLDACIQAKELIAPLLIKVNQLIMIKKKYDCQFILMQVPIIEKGSCPAMGYDQEVINFCSKIGASIEIDLYANPYDSDWDD